MQTLNFLDQATGYCAGDAGKYIVSHGSHELCKAECKNVDFCNFYGVLDTVSDPICIM